jgi:hypothetical protein
VDVNHMPERDQVTGQRGSGTPIGPEDQDEGNRLGPIHQHGTRGATAQSIVDAERI